MNSKVYATKVQYVHAIQISDLVGRDQIMDFIGADAAALHSASGDAVGYSFVLGGQAHTVSYGAWIVKHDVPGILGRQQFTLMPDEDFQRVFEKSDVDFEFAQAIPADVAEEIARQSQLDIVDVAPVPVPPQTDDQEKKIDFS